MKSHIKKQNVDLSGLARCGKKSTFKGRDVNNAYR